MTGHAPSQPVVLVVDDSERVLRAIVGTLRSLGAEAHPASSVDQALALLPLRAYTHVIADLDLHDARDGAFVLALARSHHPRCRTILISGSARLTAAAASPAIDVALRKPFSREELEAVLRAP